MPVPLDVPPWLALCVCVTLDVIDELGVPVGLAVAEGVAAALAVCVDDDDAVAVRVGDSELVCVSDVVCERVGLVDAVCVDVCVILGVCEAVCVPEALWVCVRQQCDRRELRLSIHGQASRIPVWPHLRARDWRSRPSSTTRARELVRDARPRRAVEPSAAVQRRMGRQ